ncbi:MAG: 7-carboxy-7-deazaguanine synthase QueE [Lentisphaerae bacterium]|nr:7-carboxy-7-deazaguanine synthase QueE [Lentisphaerota bacterium]
MEETFRVIEIFESLQGEGANTGMPVVFLRLAGCNLACPWCDTDQSKFEMLTANQVIEQITAFNVKAVIVTGGEPTIHTGLEEVLTRLKGRGYWLGLETNGMERPPLTWVGLFDYVAVSPKAMFSPLYDDDQMIGEADEVRIVVDGDVGEFCREIRNRIKAAYYFLSPCERGGEFNIKETIELLGQLNAGHRSGRWLLSLQTHKLAGFR